MLNLNARHIGDNWSWQTRGQTQGQTLYHIVCHYLFKYFNIIIIITIIIITSAVLLYKGSRKLAHQFWYNQPVNFIINRNTGIRVIKSEMPKSTKWTNFKNISFYSLYDKDFSLEKIQKFLTHNYARQYMYAPLHLSAYLRGHNSPVFIGCYTADINNIVGCVTAYPLNIIAKNAKIKYVYYVDNLCVKTDMRGKNIAPQMIDTLHHHIRNNTDVTKVSLFKRENYTNNYIVPIVCYNTSLYHIDNWFHTKYSLHASASVLEVSKQNINLLYNFIYTTTKFEVLIFPELSNVEALIEAKQLFIKILIVDEQVSAIYMFRDTNTLYDGVKCIECIGSINNQKHKQFFVNGFFYVLEDLYSKHNFKILQMENQSDNRLITKNITKKWSPHNIVPISWFFYNYIYPQQSPEKVLILA